MKRTVYFRDSGKTGRKLLTILAFALVFAIVWQGGVINPGNARAADNPGESLILEAKNAFKKAGTDPAASEKIMERLRISHSEGLDLAPLVSRVKEGLAKGAGAEGIARAVETRAAFMVRVNSVMKKEGFDTQSESGRQLGAAAALAMEAGIGEATMAKVFHAGRGQDPDTLTAVMNAGETLALSGATEEDSGEFMLECMERKMRRSEIREAARMARRAVDSGQGSGGMKNSTSGGQTYGHGQSQGVGQKSTGTAGGSAAAGGSTGSGRGSRGGSR